MRIALTAFGLDLLTLEVTTDSAQSDDSPGDCTTYPNGIGFTVPERDGGPPELVV